MPFYLCLILLYNEHKNENNIAIAVHAEKPNTILLITIPIKIPNIDPRIMLFAK